MYLGVRNTANKYTELVLKYVLYTFWIRDHVMWQNCGPRNSSMESAAYNTIA